MNIPIDAARPHMARLAAHLERIGALRDRRWVAAFADTPRHVFVQSWLEQETGDRGIAVWRRRRATDDVTLASVYRDTTLVTRLDPVTAEPVDETAWTGIPTSSSTQPSLMAGMLEELGAEDGHRVLEIGTGTGYNAALLCARLGDEVVHSMDIDQELVDAARQRLAGVGYQPRLLDGDGTQGWPAGGPFDRIIATCSVPAIPTAWLEQLRPGGVVVVDVALGIEGGLVRLSHRGDGRARGFFTATPGRFMPARSDARAYPARERPARAPMAGTRPTALTAEEIRANYPLRLVLAFRLPGTELVYHVGEEGTALQLQRADGSWARVPLVGEHTGMVTYGGDDGLWQEAEAAREWWDAAGRPGQDRFGYARETDGGSYVRYLPDGTLWKVSG